MRNLIRETNAGTKGWGWAAQAGTNTAKVEEVSYQGARGVKLTRLAASGSWQFISKSNIVIDGLKPSTDYTISMDVKQSNPNGFTVTIRIGDYSKPFTPVIEVPKVGTTDWKHFDIPIRTFDTLPEANGQVLYLGNFIAVPDTEVCFANVALYEGTVPQPWTPAPEEVTCTGFFPGDFEQATVNEGVSAGSSWAQLYYSQSDRIRSQQLIPLSDHFGMYVNPGYYVCLCEFGSNGYLGKDTGFMNWSTGWVYRKLNSETTHVGVCFRKADGSAITPEDATNVTGGGC